MSESDISLLTDSDEEYTSKHTFVPIPQQSGDSKSFKWTDVDTEEIERIAKQIASCVEINSREPKVHTDILHHPTTAHASKKASSKVLEAVYNFGDGEDPDAFIAGKFQNATIDDLLIVREHLASQVAGHAQQLKAYVKENFESCIRSSDTISEVAARLHAAEAEDGMGVHGATPEKVQEELEMAEWKARSIFAELLRRHRMSQNLDNVLLLLGRYDSLVLLPSMLRTAVETRDFDSLISLYQQAMKTVNIESKMVGEVQAIWERLKEEVHRAMDSAVNVLHTILLSSASSMAGSFEAACYLERMKLIGVPSATKVHSLNDFIDSQKKTIVDEFRQLRKTCVYEKSAPNKKNPCLSQELPRHRQVLGTMMNDGDNCTNILGNMAEMICIENMTLLLFEWVNEFWELRGSSSGKDVDIWHGQDDVMKQTIYSIFSEYSNLIGECVVDLSSSGICRDLSGSSIIIQTLCGCCLEMEDRLATIMLPLFRALVLHTSGQLILAGETLLKENVKQCFQFSGSCPENFGLVHGVSEVSLLLHSSLQLIKAYSTEAAKIGVKIPSDANPPHNILKSAAEASSNAAVKLAARRPVLSNDGQEVDELILLYLWNALEEIKTFCFPQIATYWHTVLLAASSGDEVTTAFKWSNATIEDAQETLIRAWVEIKLEKMEGTMKNLLDVEQKLCLKAFESHGDSSTSIMEPSSCDYLNFPYAIRACVWELIISMGACDADIDALVTVLREEVMGEIQLAILEGIENLVMNDVFLRASLLSKCQVWLDVQALRSWLIRASDETSIETDSESLLLITKLCRTIESLVRNHVEEQLGSSKGAAFMLELKSNLQNIVDHSFLKSLS